MIVYYRLCGIPSTNPSPIYQEDKKKLNELCLRSFVGAYDDIKPKTIFLCDYCSPDYAHLIESVVPFKKEIIFSESGINGTAVKQFMMAEEAKDEIILFQECDYIYQPSIGKKMEKAVRELEMVSPYDHPDHYKDEGFKIKMVGDTHYRSADNNTMTFGIRGDVFRDHADIFKEYGYLDHENWEEMLILGHTLWIPVPSFATHMVKNYMAPSVDWKKEWSRYDFCA
jgi:hypothetical protein